MSDESKIIPINRSLIRALTDVLDLLAKNPWPGPAKFNAILIDRADMYKMIEVGNPPPPNVRLAVRPRYNLMLASSAPLDSSCAYETREFSLFRRIGDKLEYREI